MEIIVISLAASITAILTFFSGFGLGTILTPVFAIFFPVDKAIAMTGVVHFSNNLFKITLVGKNTDKAVLLRFGIPAILASFEIICGTLMLIGFSVRIAAIPLFIIMMTAIATTKIPILVEKGFWFMAHEARTDFAMTLLIVFLFIYGAGRISIDYRIYRKLNSK